jgi:hypothetical protein
MWWGHQVHQMLLQPLASRSCSGKAEVFHIGAVSRQAAAGQPRRWVLTSGTQDRRQVLIMGAGRSKAKPSNDSQGSDRQQQVKAFIPAVAIAPADIGLPSQRRVVWHHGSPPRDYPALHSSTRGPAAGQRETARTA